MKRFGTAAIAILAILAIFMGGCGKTGVFNVAFNEEYDSSDWGRYVIPGHEATAVWNMENNGLYIDEMYWYTPYGYAGDITLTVVFDLTATLSKLVKELKVGFSDGAKTGYTSYALFELYNLGNPGSAHFYVHEKSSSGSPQQLAYDTDPNLKGSGNTVVIKKTGNKISIELNGVSIITSKVLGEFAALTTVPTFQVLMDDGVPLRFKSVKVEYKGDPVFMGYM